jgi:tRNA A37 threonylcarbamoyltransferase TsaD
VKNCNFSFSGLKTAAIDIINKNKNNKRFLENFCASFQYTVGEIFKKKIENSLDEMNNEGIKFKDFSICGGVAG